MGLGVEGTGDQEGLKSLEKELRRRLGKELKGPRKGSKGTEQGLGR